MTNLERLRTLGQSVWLDDLRRAYINDGTLQQLIDEGLSGVTSNPAIFAAAMSESNDYDVDIERFTRAGAAAAETFQRLAVDDIQRAADLLRPIYDACQGRDGFVSLEVSPHLAHDTAGTVQEARHLWSAVSRPNVMIKVPGTTAGLPAIRQLIAEGLNINVTLLFSVTRYREVIDAYWRGLEDRGTAHKSLERVASVASFFLSRIDVLVDRLLDEKEVADQSLRGSAATTAAARVWQVHKRSLEQQRWQHLSMAGARPQRVLWASTGTKNPNYSDVKYIEPLIAANTVTTMPMATLLAYRDHGEPAPRLDATVKNVDAMETALVNAGIDLETVAEELEREGIRKFTEPFDQMMRRLEEKQRQFVAA